MEEEKRMAEHRGFLEPVKDRQQRKKELRDETPRIDWENGEVPAVLFEPPAQEATNERT